MVRDYTNADILSDWNPDLASDACYEEHVSVLESLALAAQATIILRFEVFIEFLQDCLVKYLDYLFVIRAWLVKTDDLVFIHFNEMLLSLNVLIWLLFEE